MVNDNVMPCDGTQTHSFTDSRESSQFWHPPYPSCYACISWESSLNFEKL